MDRSYFIKLTIALYRVSNGFPQKEPLKFLIRERASAVLADLILSGRDSKQTNRTLGNIEALLALFEVAKSQEWVNEDNFLILCQEYDKIARSINQKPVSAPKEPVKKQKQAPVVTSQAPKGKKRWEEILEILRQKECLQVKDLQVVFPDVSKRTLRRDFEYLLGQGLVQRIGDRNDTEYRLR